MDLQSPVRQSRTTLVAVTAVAAAPAPSQPVRWVLHKQIFALWLLGASAAAAGTRQLRFLGVCGGRWDWAVGLHPEFCSCCLTLQRPFPSSCRRQQKQAVEHLILPFVLSALQTIPFCMEPCNKCWHVPSAKCNGMRKNLCCGHSSTSCLSNSSRNFPRCQWLQAERQLDSSQTHKCLLFLPDKPQKDTRDGVSWCSTARAHSLLRRDLSGTSAPVLLLLGAVLRTVALH